MQRYIVFTGYRSNPSGGWRDLAGEADTMEQALAIAALRQTEKDEDWWQVVDTETGKMVKFHD